MNHAERLKDIQGLLQDDSLFTTINTYSSDTLFNSDIFSIDELKEKATEYFFHSGDKRLTKLAKYWNDNATDLTALILMICKAVVSRFGRNWNYIQGSYFIEDYNPLENYAMKEERKPDLTDTTENEIDFKTHQEVKNSVFGFDSTTAVDSNRTESDTSGNKLENKSKSTTTKKGSETIERSGNIGVTTSQQMLQSEIDVRKFDFWAMVFRDLDVILCQQVY